MTDAVIFVPAGAVDAATGRCLDYCAARRYHVVGLVPGDWAAAVRMVDDGLAGVIVVPSLDRLDPEREPRIEVAPRRRANRRAAATRFTTRIPG